MEIHSDWNTLSPLDKYFHTSFLRSIGLENEKHLYPRFSYTNMMLNGKLFYFFQNYFIKKIFKIIFFHYFSC